MKVVRGIERAQAAEAGVDHPQLIIPIVRHFMDVDVTRDVDAAGQVTSTVLAGGFELPRAGGYVAVIPNGVSAADGEPRLIGGDAHWFPKRA